MDTDQLIRTLAADNATRTRSVGAALSLALAIALPIAIAAFFATLGFRSDIRTAMHNPFFDFKFVVTLSLAASALDASTAEWVIGITMTTTGLLSVGTALSRWYTAYRALVAPAPVAEAAAPTPEPVRPIPIAAGADLRRPVEQH